MFCPPCQDLHPTRANVRSKEACEIEYTFLKRAFFQFRSWLLVMDDTGDKNDPKTCLENAKREHAEVSDGCKSQLYKFCFAKCN